MTNEQINKAIKAAAHQASKLPPEAAEAILENKSLRAENARLREAINRIEDFATRTDIGNDDSLIEIIAEIQSLEQSEE